MRLKLIPILLLAFCTVSLCGEVPEAPADLKPGMERGKWLPEAWANPGTVERIDSKGRKLLKLAFAGGEKEKTAFQHSTGFSIAKDGKISLQIYSENPLGVSIALLAGTAYTWHESNVIELKPGWNKLEFAVSAAEWKTEASQWKNSTSVVPLSDIRAVDIVLNNKDKSGEVYVYGFQYDLDDQGKDVAKQANDLRSDDADVRAGAERALVGVGKPAIEALSQLAEDEDSQEVQIRASLILQGINKAAAAAQAQRTGTGEVLTGVVPVENAVGAQDTGVERAVRRATAKVQEAAGRANANPEAVKKAQAELESIRAEMQKLQERSAALIKTLEEAPEAETKVAAPPMVPKE